MVKLTNLATCRIVASITGDPGHAGKCPITMTRKQWDSIKGLVKIKKQNDPVSKLMDIFGMTK